MHMQQHPVAVGGRQLGRRDDEGAHAVDRRLLSTETFMRWAQRRQVFLSFAATSERPSRCALICEIRASLTMLTASGLSTTTCT
jgi:hypothetical protein